MKLFIQIRMLNKKKINSHGDVLCMSMHNRDTVVEILGSVSYHVNRVFKLHQPPYYHSLMD